MRKADFAIGIYILAAIVFLIVPMRSSLLDVLLALNISIAMIILFNALFSQEVLNMSTFPTILLFTTTFRISLNVSSTKLILTTGDPGAVVTQFGEFVGRGDPVVGMIVFIILIIVQFLVINKGSERVSEVTARFTLDAMPGKQMAIDADLNRRDHRSAGEGTAREDTGRIVVLRFHGRCYQVCKGRCDRRSYYHCNQLGGRRGHGDDARRADCHGCT